MKTIAIGIPAYNEEVNIAHVVHAMLSQNENDFVIEKVIVASDGSCDATADIVRGIKDNRLVLIDDLVRRGKSYRQNQLFDYALSDILVLVDADIRFEDPEAIAKITAPIRIGIADLTGQWAMPDVPRTYLEKVLIAGHNFKQSVYLSLRGGNNIYTCVGHMRAFSRPLYQKLRFDENNSTGEDQFSYLMSLSNGFKYQYPQPIKAYFKLPSILSDYISYAKRVFITQRKFVKDFGADFVKAERSIPKILLLKIIIIHLFKSPITFSLYLLLHCYMAIYSLFVKDTRKAYYMISRSTK